VRPIALTALRFMIRVNFLDRSTADACLVRMREASYCVNAISVALCVP